MRFETLAKRALERGDVLRALVLLVEGLKRHDDDEAYEQMLEIYGELCPNPGVESDLVGVVVMRPDAPRILGQLRWMLEERGQPRMVRALERAAADHGVSMLAYDPDAHDEAPEVIEEYWEEAPLLELQDDLLSEDEAFVEEEAFSSEEEDVEAYESEPLVEARPISELETEELPRREVLAPTPEPSARVQMRSTRVPESRRGRWAGAVVGMAAVAIVLGAGLGWFSLTHHAQERVIDSQMEMFDPLNPAAFAQAFEQVEGGWGSSPRAIDERSRFVDALVALEQGRTAEASLEAEPASAWGHGAQVFGALSQQSYEPALASLLVLERMAPESLVTLWVRARFEEARGKLGAARDAYERAAHQNPRFVPGWLGLMRVALRTGDRQGLSRAADALQGINPLHPYLNLLELEVLRAPEMARLMVRGHNKPRRSLGSTRDVFLRALDAYTLAIRAWHQGDPRGARREVERALGLDPHLGPALLMHGALQASGLQVDRAMETWDRLANLDGVGAELRLELMSLGPRALTAAGRPDLAMRYVLELPGDLGVRVLFADRAEILERLQTRPVSLSLSEEALRTHAQGHTDAFYELARTLQSLGWNMTALKILDEMERAGLVHPASKVLRATSLSMSGRRRRAQELKVAGDVSAPMIDAMLELWGGTATRAHEHTTIARTSWEHSPEWLRWHGLALLGNGRSGQVRTLLERVPISPVYSSLGERLKLRTFAKLRRGNKEFKESQTRLEALSPTSVSLMVDLAVANFWQGELEPATTWATKAVERAPRHPGANWIMGLIYRHQGKMTLAREHLGRANVQTEDDPRLLMDLGRVYLDMGKDGQAQKVFYRALLAQKASLEAIRGLGRSYLKKDREIGKRELRRILDRWYEGRADGRAQAGELLKWLAILEGSRTGSEAGLQNLKQAQEKLGQRPDVLVELARYYHAVGRTTDARRFYIEALRRDTTMASAHIGLAETALKEGDDRVARDHLRKYLELDPFGGRVDWARKRLAKLQESSDAKGADRL